MQNKVRRKIIELYDIAEEKTQDVFVRPKVTFDLKGTDAGQAWFHKNKLRFNPFFLEKYTHEFLAYTVPHEVAHLISCNIFGPDIKPHGKEWKFIMRDFFQVPAQRCHNYAVHHRRIYKFIYLCACKDEEILFSPTRHKRASAGTSYVCKVCKQVLRHSHQKDKTI